MQLLNKGKANRKERDLFYSTRARPERKTGSRVVFAECLQKKRRRYDVRGEILRLLFLGSACCRIALQRSGTAP